MKSQVSNLLHVVQGLHKDVLAAYPALEGDLTKDFGRLALYCRERGIGFFTLDLPHLESLLLSGLESGRLMLEGPLSHRVSKRIKVPRLYSGLWLRIFDRDACLKQDVDVTALAFLRQLLVVGKKLELGCSFDRTQAVVGAYHDIERKLRRPNLDWAGDSLYSRGRSVDPDHHDLGQRTDLLPFHDSPVPIGGQEVSESESTTVVVDVDPLRHLHLVQALDGRPENLGKVYPLFRGSELDGDPSNIQRKEDIRLLNQVQRVADLILETFSTFDPILYSEELEECGEGIGFRHGPGAVAERLKNWEKSQFPNWPRKLQQTFPFESCGKTIGSDCQVPPNHEVASRLIAVPKTTKGPRLIAAEPTSHQWCQQLLLRFLFDQCRNHFGGDFIDFKDQSKSADMVLRASLDRSLTTVDLSDASDRLTCWTVERLFRRNPSILNALHAARTRYLRDDISEVPSFLSLRKFASQGTATTFPVMSLVMLFIALGVTIKGDVTWHKIRKERNRVRVFGDDIIIPTSGYAGLVRTMDLLQLKVNVAKSYVNGHFRESCGADGYIGYDVTPCKPKTLVADSPESSMSVVDLSNNLFLKGYWHASNSCLDLLPARLRRGIRIVGRDDSGFRGLTSYTRGDESHLIRRWNSRLHRYEVRVWTLLVRSHKRPRDGFSAFLDFVARKHSPEHARTVSEFADIRKTRIGLQWEPHNTDARLSVEH